MDDYGDGIFRELTYERAKETPDWAILPKEPIKWSWYKSGKKELIEQHPHEFDSENGVSELRIRIAIDGDQVTQASFARENVGEITSIMKTRKTIGFYSKASPANYFGLRLHSRGDSVLSLLSSPECRIVGREVIQGEDCLHLDCETVQLSEGYSVHYELWLIPRRGYLPKKILSTSRVKVPDGEWITRKNNQTVEKFMQVEDRLLGRSRSFPEVCVSRGNGTTMTLRVTACVINQKVSPANLVVTPQIGTEITTLEPGKFPKQEIHGGGKGLERIRQ